MIATKEKIEKNKKSKSAEKFKKKPNSNQEVVKGLR